MAGFGNLADPRNNRLAMQLIGSGNYNNGTVYGGLAHALQQGMLGYIAGEEAANQKQAQDVLKQAGQAMTGRYEAMGPMEDGTAGYIDQQPPNGRLAAQLLMSSPYTAAQGMQLATMLDARDAENQQWNDRFNTQNAAAEKRFGQGLGPLLHHLVDGLVPRRQFVGIKLRRLAKSAGLGCEGIVVVVPVHLIDRVVVGRRASGDPLVRQPLFQR